MLVLTIRVGERVVIGDNVVTILGLSQQGVEFRLKTPKGDSLPQLKQVDEEFAIAEGVTVKVLEIKSGRRVELGIQAPRNVPIHRSTAEEEQDRSSKDRE